VVVGPKKPKLGFAVLTKLLKPVLKFVFIVVRATPRPTNPDPNPPRNLFWNELPVNVGLKTDELATAGKVTVGLGIVPTSGLRIPATLFSPVENVVGTALAKLVLDMRGSASIAVLLRLTRWRNDAHDGDDHDHARRWLWAHHRYPCRGPVPRSIALSVDKQEVAALLSIRRAVSCAAPVSTTTEHGIT
jgi:hypothetical protein